MHPADSLLRRWAGLMGLTIILAISFSTALNAQSNCTHYASPAGSGNGLSSSSPFQISNFGPVAKPASTLCLLNGTYTGANSMINPPDGVSGSAGSPITVRAITDGGVLIDGKGAWVPIHLEQNNYWIIEGVNATAGASGIEDVVELGPGASNNIIRRVCAWDAGAGNTAVFWNYHPTATNNLLEDVCAFGSGRKMIANGQSGNSNFTVRRAFAMWNTSNENMGAGVIENAYVSYDGVCENCIATADMDAGARTLAQTNGLFADGHWGDGTTYTSQQICSRAKYLGSIAYTLAAQTLPSFQTSAIDASQYIDCRTFQDVVVYAEDGRSILTLNDVTSLQGYPGPKGVQTYKNGTEIGSGPSYIGGSWTVTNRAKGASVAAVPNIWNGSGSTGARVCYRYINGVLTAIPLWPWPMNQRIIDALVSAGRVPIDVTKTMESIFGAIPATCKESQTVASAPVNPPSNLRAVTITP